MMNWIKFVEDLEKDPKSYMQAIVQNLSPPKYILAKLRAFEAICHFCWSPRVDICVNCQESICEEHSVMIIGEKTKLDWYFCPICQNKIDTAAFVKKQDEQFWLEDQAESSTP